MLIISDLHFGANIENRLEQFSVLSRSKEFNPESLVIIPGDLMTNYTKIFSETEFKEIYPKTKDFGIWAWCTTNEQKAIQRFEAIGPDQELQK